MPVGYICKRECVWGSAWCKCIGLEPVGWMVKLPDERAPGTGDPGGKAVRGVD